MTADYRYLEGNPDSAMVLNRYAKEERREPTKAEALLWEHLRANNLGIHFRRQFLIGDYIVDFVFLKGKLVIEVDGDYHLDPDQQHADAQRTLYLLSRGYKVIRFSNAQVLTDIEAVITEIIHNLCWKDSDLKGPDLKGPNL